MTGMAARHRRAGATRLTARICDHASSDDSVTGPSFVPGSTALLTSTVSVPNRSTAASTSSAALASRARSAGTKTASPSMPSITRPPRSESRPVTTTRAPSEANSRAMWTPMPAVDPVTRATSPSSRPTSGAEDVGQLRGNDDLELVVGAGLGIAVGAPALEVGRVAEALALHVLVGDLANKLGAQRLPRHVLALAPAAEPAGHRAPRRSDRLRPPGPRVAVEGVLPVGRQLVDQLLAPAHGERAGDADVVEVAVRVVEPEQQRPDDPAALVPAEPGDDAVGRALVLDLDHHPLVLAVVDVLPLDDNTVESGALETIEPVARDTRIGGEWRQVDRRLEGLADLLQVRPPIGER